MKITLPKKISSTKEFDLLVAPIFMGESKKKTLSPVFSACNTLKELDKKIGGHLFLGASEEGFEAKSGQQFQTHTLGKIHAKSVALLGLGEPLKQDLDVFRKSAGEAYKVAQKKRAKKVSVLVPKDTTLPLYDVVQAFAEGFNLASYKFDRYLTKNKKENYVKEVELILPSESDAENKDALKRAESMCKGVNIARDLINEGPMVLNPQNFAKHAQDIATETGLGIEVLDEKKLKKERMELMLAVSSAAQNISPPRLIKLVYKPSKASKQTVSLIGKGVTFDSGGLDIKPPAGMVDMKIDMSGAAAVLGTMRAIAYLKPKVNVVGYLACVENGIGSHAYHPGDIIKSRQGITVEIDNTDAEGRLVLADTICYSAEKDKPDTIIDVATLTGACMVALGLKTAGLFSNDDDLAKAIYSSGQSVGEDFWRLPLNPTLKDGLRSNVADLKNCGDRWGGSITAALFLQEFVKEKIKWAHLDIAGPATNSAAHPYLPTGGAGFAVRTLANYLCSL